VIFVATIFVGAIVSEDPSPPSAARSWGGRKREVAAKVLAIRTMCRRFRIPGFILMGKDLRIKTDFTLPRCYPEPYGEFLNQSKTIIGAGKSRGNLSEGRRTTRVIWVTE
jgi:hypothetical protein